MQINLGLRSKKNPTIGLLVVLLLIGPGVLSQSKQTSSVSQVWVGYFNQARFSKHWGMWTDLQLRTKEDFFSNFSQSIVRLGLTYYVRDDLKLTGGYAFVNHFPSENHRNISQPEHRTWQQVQWHNRFPKIRLMQWFRLEERWRRKILNDDNLGEGNDFNFRLRYNFLFQAALGKKKFETGSLSMILNNEVHINFGKEIVYNYFDQNRFFAGFNYHLNSHNNIQLGYLNVFQQLPAGSRYRVTHAARLFYFHNLDLRRK